MTGYNDPYYDLTPIKSPVAGSGFTFKIPGDWYVKPVSLVLTLATSAAVASRGIALQYQDGDGNVYGQYDQLTLQTASLTNVYTWAIGIDTATVDPAKGPGTKVIPDILMPPGHRLVVAVSAIQAADQISAAFLWARKYPNGPVESAYGAIPFARQEGAGG